MPIEGNGYVAMVDREHFDEFLRERAASAGAERITGTFQRELPALFAGSQFVHGQALLRDVSEGDHGREGRLLRIQSQQVARHLQPDDFSIGAARGHDPVDDALAGALVLVVQCHLRHLDHRLELRDGQLAREVLHAAVRRDDEALRLDDLERAPDALGDELRGLGLGRAGHGRDAAGEPSRPALARRHSSRRAAAWPSP